MQWILFFILTLSIHARAASCCGGGSVLPALITGDDKVQVATTFSVQSNQAFVDGEGNWHRPSQADISQVFKLDSAMILSDRLQTGVSLPFQQRDLGVDSSHLNVGDTVIDFAYEALPEWTYSRFIPKGFVFLTTTAPTGKSIYETSHPLAIDVTGKGFWSVAVGGLLTKSWGPWDTNFTFDIHHSFERTLTTPMGPEKYVPNNGVDFVFGGGYSIGPLRGGASLTILYEDPINGVADPLLGGLDSTGVPQRVWTGAVTLAYLLSPELSMTVSYSDQMLFGQPQNTYLTRTLAVAIQQRWPR